MTCAGHDPAVPLIPILPHARTLPFHRVLPLTLALLAFSFSACSEGEGSRVQRDRLGDTLSVLSSTPRIPDTLVPRETARIGMAEGPLEYIFNQIFSFTVTPSGEVLVHDEGEGIRRYDAQGRYLGHLARQGEGPGEVGYALGLTASRTGDVAAYDLGNARITVFREDGGFRTLRRPDGMPSYNEDVILYHDDGSLWVAISPTYPPEGGIPHPRPVFARVAESGALVDTVFTPGSLGTRCPMLSDRQNRSGFWEDRREPYFPKAKWSSGPDGTLVFGCPAEYRFHVVGQDGSLVRVQRPWLPLEMAQEEKDLRAKFGLLPELPDQLPAYVRVVVPGDGRIWVWPTQPSMKIPLPPEAQEAVGETHTWLVSWQGSFDVFSDDGEWLAVVRLPEEARYSGFPTEPSVFIRGDTIWAVAQDSMDVQYVARYEVEGLPGME